jgi:hypothetical protein
MKNPSCSVVDIAGSLMCDGPKHSRGCTCFSGLWTCQHKIRRKVESGRASATRARTRQGSRICHRGISKASGSTRRNSNYTGRIERKMGGSESGHFLFLIRSRPGRKSGMYELAVPAETTLASARLDEFRCRTWKNLLF